MTVAGRSAFALGLLVALLSACGDEEVVVFSGEAWRSAPAGSNERYGMARDLIRRELLLGLTLDETEQLLGDGRYSSVTRQAVYNLGGPNGVASFGNTLIIEFNDALIATDVFIYRE